MPSTKRKRRVWPGAILLHDRPADAGFCFRDPLELEALYKPLPAGTPVKSGRGRFMCLRYRDSKIPSGRLTTGHIIATGPAGPFAVAEKYIGTGGYRLSRKRRGRYLPRHSRQRRIQEQCWREFRTCDRADTVTAGKNNDRSRGTRRRIRKSSVSAC